MGATFIRLDPERLNGRIDATYYRPQFVANEERLRTCGAHIQQLNNLIHSGRRAVYFSTSTIEREEAPDNWVPFLTSDDFGTEGFGIDLNARRYVSPEFADQYPNGRLRANELLVKVKGPNQITAYNSKEPTKRVLVSGTIWGALVRNDQVDPHYLVTVLSSDYAVLARSRLRTNLNVEFLSPSDLVELELPVPRNRCAQKYIGDKVRQAEWLRRIAAQLRLQLTNLVNIPLVTDALEIKRVRTNKIRSDQFAVYRLDSKYYSARALAILEACKSSGSETIRALEPVISNGFESRVFVENGHPYLTVSEISSSRVDIKHAPRIDFNIVVPQKAAATRNCVLVVRGGSVGIAAKVHKDDEGAAISSDLIRLEFGDEELAAAVAVFLGSPAGKELMVRASYGAVMPKLGQDELLDIPIPKHVLSLKRPILNLLNSYEQAIRIAGILVQSAKLLVEALIEVKITEDEIAEAQTQLEHGDQMGDRAILARLYEGGIDATEGIRLFNDLDMYYETLQLAEKTDENESTNDSIIAYEDNRYD